jgi:hypothetical protein
LQIKTQIVSCHTADSKPVNQEVNCTVILPPLVFPGIAYRGVYIGDKTIDIITISNSGDLKRWEIFY